MKKVSFLIVVCMFLVVACSDSKKDSTTTTTTTSTTTTTAPTFEETAETQKILNPCEVISIEHVDSIVPNSQMHGPLVQTAVAPSKACEYFIQDQQSPRVGVSIALSTTIYDASEAKKVADAAVGDKAFIVDGYVTGFGGAACGKTIIVKLREYSYTVAVCKDNDKSPSDEELIELANDVSNSLP